jgi:hypothetical protein
MGLIRQCKECGDLLVGRLDKIYCSDNCRSTYNNRIYRGSNYHIRSINSILRNNRSILKNNYDKGRTRVNKNLLVQMGYNFVYFTYEIGGKNGTIYRYCYEYGYCMTDDNKIDLVIKKDVSDLVDSVF